jgi:hypothetical protein
MLQLQRNVPPPVARLSATDKRKKYPFETMRVDDFFFVEGKQRNSIRTYFSTAGAKHGITLKSQLIHARLNELEQWEPCPEDAPGATIGVGVWRTA